METTLFSLPPTPFPNLPTGTAPVSSREFAVLARASTDLAWQNMMWTVTLVIVPCDPKQRMCHMFNHLQVLHLTFACISLQIIFKLNQGNWHGGVVQQCSRHFFVLLGSSWKIMKNQVNVTFKQIKTCIGITILISQNIAKKSVVSCCFYLNQIIKSWQ